MSRGYVLGVGKQREAAIETATEPEDVAAPAVGPEGAPITG
ncbi:hypothetical protein [Sorangium sp. So ce128]